MPLKFEVNNKSAYINYDNINDNNDTDTNRFAFIYIQIEPTPLTGSMSKGGGPFLTNKTKKAARLSGSVGRARCQVLAETGGCAGLHSQTGARMGLALSILYGATTCC